MSKNFPDAISYRPLRLFLKIAMVLVFLAIVPPANTSARQPALTTEEQAWLDNHPVLKLAPDPNFLPFEAIDEKGVYTGIAADYVALLEKKLGIKFQIEKFSNWTEALTKARRKEADLWGAATPTPQRLEYMNFTKPYLELPAVIIVRNNVEKRLTLENLDGMNVAVISGYGIHDYLDNHKINFRIDAVPDIENGLKKVSFGLADAMVVNIALASHYIERIGLSNLRIAGESGYVYRWGVAVRKDWPELIGILEKGFGLISENENRRIHTKWIGLKPASSFSRTFWISLASILGVLAVASIVAWNMMLKKKVNEQTLELKRELESHEKTEEKLEVSNQLLNAIRKAQARFIEETELKPLFDQLLEEILSLTQSEFGFIGKVLTGSEGKPYLKTYTISNIAWNEDTRALYNKNAETGFEFTNLDSLFGAVLVTGDNVIANDPGNDSRRCGLPPGHPPLNSFLGLPFSHGGKMTGMVGIANRPGGYNQKLAEFLQPFLFTCSNLMIGQEMEDRRRAAEEALIQTKEEAEEANRAKSDFLARMSHEFRTPLNSILGFSQLLEMSKTDPPTPGQKKNLDRIANSGNQMLELVNEILDLANLEEGRINLRLQDVNAVDLQTELLLYFKSMADSYQVSLVDEKAGDPPFYVLADPARLRQVLVNLISNAIKYNRKNGTVTLSLKKEGELCLIQVTDTGPGIPERIQARIFEPFDRLEADNYEVSGAGIGLSIAKRLTILMNGTIGFDSVEGNGSCFYIKVPLANGKTIREQSE